ncbi:uncharacterized protein BKCO1_3000202 [Diplodia corticola]|uniref:Uncharacterized protein n=1 Tax=Diplodia corticola TaxID=236234 RepID=A0A1J9RBB9_9PEZI|nr:uncharacterized protein BKCO1_3000202 [Diplodia corticola]OJD38902.1 hypothetical protein BKCO1_3000202 [Diplodia corticola]
MSGIRKVANVGIAISRMGRGAKDDDERKEDYDGNLEGDQFRSDQRGLHINRKNKSKTEDSGRPPDLMSPHIPTSQHPERFQSVPPVLGTQAPSQGSSMGPPPWSPMPSQDSNSMNSQTYCGSVYPTRPVPGPMRQNSAPVQGSGQQVGSGWAPEPAGYYDEPATYSNRPVSYPDSQYAQQNPHSMNVDPYQAHQPAGVGNYTVAPGHGGYSEATYQTRTCIHGIAFGKCASCSYGQPWWPSG